MPVSHPLALLGLAALAGVVMTDALSRPLHAAKRPSGFANAAPLFPEILTSASNRVPACIDPARLDQKLAERHPAMEPRFRGIAKLYKLHGEQLGVRWDYAFYQMVLETNSLKFTGDVRARQNNFAGLGATGGGVRGESFPDVSTGVLAQLQHLVAYAGIRVDRPVAKRTRDNQDDIIKQSRKLGRAIRFNDLTNRWAMDGSYARSIEVLANLFHEASCRQPAPPANTAADAASNPGPARSSPAGAGARAKATSVEATRARVSAIAPKSDLAGIGPPPARDGQGAPTCRVMTASFGGTLTLLIRAQQQADVIYTALVVDEASADAMARSFIETHAPGGVVAGRFPSRDDAVSNAYQLCDRGL